MLTKITKKKINILKKIHENILKMQQRLATYINKKRKKALLLKKKKLNSIKVDAFFIKKIKKFKIYELNLLKNVKILKTFNIFFVKINRF